MERLSDILGASLARRLQADTPVISYSGEAASAVLLQLAAQLSAKPPAIYTIGPAGSRFSVSSGAKLITANLGLEITPCR